MSSETRVFCIIFYLCNKMSKQLSFVSTIDTLSWTAIVLSWVAAMFLRLVQSVRPGALGAIRNPETPPGVLLYEAPVYQLMPVIAGTLLFAILAAMLRRNPTSKVSYFVRCLRLAVAVAALYFTISLVI